MHGADAGVWDRVAREWRLSLRAIETDLQAPFAFRRLRALSALHTGALLRVGPGAAAPSSTTTTSSSSSSSTSTSASTSAGTEALAAAAAEVASLVGSKLLAQAAPERTLSVCTRAALTRSRAVAALVVERVVRRSAEEGGEPVVAVELAMALSALAGLCWVSERVRDVVADTDAVNALVEQLRMASTRLRTAALDALLASCWRHAANEERMVQCGGVEAVLGLARTPAQSTAVQRRAAECLVLLTSRGGAKGTLVRLEQLCGRALCVKLAAAGAAADDEAPSNEQLRSLMDLVAGGTGRAAAGAGAGAGAGTGAPSAAAPWSAGGSSGSAVPVPPPSSGGSASSATRT